ncbi:hypothetical protein KSF_102780 [Reticulibacter mediterranei]|uniref:Uncharacterized protein n=1 Tax=Reticulibacter mediterranei TaxID=2778369 RepID=A0A8J3J0S9_9CHLR|nr:hypothetical protein KSF_102780 [Reticulibacter mediterranei]
MANVWIPLAAELTAANVPDSEQAPFLLHELPLEVRFVLGDRHYNRDELQALCTQDGRLLVTTKYGRYPHTDDGVEVRRTFHKLRLAAIENFSARFHNGPRCQGTNPGQSKVSYLFNSSHLLCKHLF